MIETSKQFRAARQKLGWSLADAAEHCRVNDRTVRRWEAGKGTPNGRDPHPSACKLLELELEAREAEAREASRG